MRWAITALLTFLKTYPDVKLDSTNDTMGRLTLEVRPWDLVGGLRPHVQRS